VTGAEGTREIPLALPDPAWSDLLTEIDQLAPDDRVSLALSGDVAPALRVVRSASLIARGYSWAHDTAGDLPWVLLPRPATVVHIVSPQPSTDGSATWIPHLSADHFHQHLLATDVDPEVFGTMASWCAGEKWDLDRFVRRSQWAEFVIEFMATREVDVVQVVAAPLGVDLIPALRAAYPSARVVVDVDGMDAQARTWLSYVTSRYGNVVDALCAPRGGVLSQLSHEGALTAKVHLWPTEGDDAAASLHGAVYGELLAHAAG
jgi:hypothetical protein